MRHMKMNTEDIEPFRIFLGYLADTDWKNENGVLAEKSKISGGYLSEILSGKKVPSQKVAVSIANACGYDKYENFITDGIKHIEKMDERVKKSFSTHKFLYKMMESHFNSMIISQDEINKYKDQGVRGEDIQILQKTFDEIQQEIESKNIPGRNKDDFRGSEDLEKDIIKMVSKIRNKTILIDIVDAFLSIERTNKKRLLDLRIDTMGTMIKAFDDKANKIMDAREKFVESLKKKIDGHTES